jgi:hypothetical protein
MTKPTTAILMALTAILLGAATTAQEPCVSPTPAPPAAQMQAWPQDRSLSWRWALPTEYPPCDYGRCWAIFVRAARGCPTFLFGRLQFTDVGGVVIGDTNDMASAVAPNQTVRLVFQSAEEGIGGVRLSELECL